MKLCLCCASEYDTAQWLMLPLVGTQHGDEQLPSLELRNCKCGSTLAVQLPPWRIRIGGEEIVCNTKAHASEAFKRAAERLPKGTIVSIINPRGVLLGTFSKGLPMEAQ
jgi:hypothetical protein